MTIKPAIVVNSVSKTYKLYNSRYDRIKEWFHPLRKKYHVKHQALKDVSFTLERGEILGIIGENGSGKSTLLKILASVASPTSGSFTCDGRLTALLELSGGFNKEISGIENIYYLGAIQGYTKDEMKSRAEKILKFADIGEYAYQPVKNYSSGMSVRLAFSLSINIDPEILITDEALSVGDLRFQQKCFRRIREFKNAGKTILICTHSLGSVKEFCTKAIWLHKGEIREQGDPDYVTGCYSNYMNAKPNEKAAVVEEINNEIFLPQLKSKKIPKALKKGTWSNLSGCDSKHNGSVLIRFAVLVETATLQKKRRLFGGEDITVFLFITSEVLIKNATIQLTLNNAYGSPVFQINNRTHKHLLMIAPENRPTVISVQFQFPNVCNGSYSLTLGVNSPEDSEILHNHIVHDALVVEVANKDPKYKTAALMVITEATFQIHRNRENPQ